jgi:hypothetical protein
MSAADRAPAYPESLVESEGATFFLTRAQEGGRKMLGVVGDPGGLKDGFTRHNGTRFFPLTQANAAALRARLEWLRPQPLGVQLSAGFGDRLGNATPGHIRALRSLPEPGAAPIFAQQSVRENARTHRTPQQVMDDATWGVFQAGWRKPWGADADHLKTTTDLDSFWQAGFTFFTIDPGDHVDDAAADDEPETLRQKAAGLPWDVLHSSLAETLERYRGQTAQAGDVSIVLDEITLLRALAKYGRAIAHSAQMAFHLRGLEQRANRPPADLEVSVDETALPTSFEEHYFIASELRRLGVRWTSLAPRFVGRFEKGVDYIGDMQNFERDIAGHAALARMFSSRGQPGYRLSLHSGSDKFSIYPIAARHTRGLLHLKTAGTSYLEALRVAARYDPGLFRNILQLSLAHYDADRASYHVSASAGAVPTPDGLPDADLPALLDQFDARQVFHVTFGATLDAFGPALLQTVTEQEEAYLNSLAVHFRRHLVGIA